MDLDELHYWTLSDLAVALGKREISPERTTDQMQSLSVLSGSKGVLALDALKPLDENMEAVLKQLFPSWSEAR